MIERLFTTMAITAATIAGAGAVMFAGAGSALAPEPAKPSTYLSGTNGAYVGGYFVNTPSKSTTIIAWSSTAYRYAINGVYPAIGTPCHVGRLNANSETASVIYDDGAGRYCW